MNIVEKFIEEVIAAHKTGAATEHSYRPALQSLFNALAKGVTALNEPKRVACGAPDFIIQRGEIVIGHAEAKDVGVSIRTLNEFNKNQQERYRKALPNLIYTNCLDWDFYQNGEIIATVSIASLEAGISPKKDQYETLENLLRNFIAQRPQTITSPRVLAEMMAGKAMLIKDVLFNTLKADENLQSDISEQYHAFREHLIHDITAEDFADIYAETIAYGMFAARLHDLTLDTFSRQEALTLLPKSNPFLRNLFGYVAGVDLDERISWIIDDLAGVFQAANVAKIMEGFGKLTGRQDPFLHFYETFLAAYNPSKRKARGVWYTPEPVVNFIVRAIDYCLENEFGLVDGLADTSKITIDWDTGQNDKKGKKVTIKKEVHRVQILDPATGTGTFLAEVVKQIAPKIKGVAAGMWSSYIEKDLIPRLHGFELLMASYAMCHMKLDMILTELGYKPTGTPPRLSVFLTNSLEEGEPANQALPFAQWLSNEVKQADSIKRDMPIMCVIGNPPYSGISQNMGEWISNLIEEYKYVDGAHFGERKHWLHDDYVKFIRLSENLIEKNGEGILGFITNHGYLDNPTFRGMRWHLMQSFDKIYILDLHGNANKKEESPDGIVDKNVFDIRQGVAIIIGVRKKGEARKPATVMHAEFWGGREHKYQRLWDTALDSGCFSLLHPEAPYYMFVPSKSGAQAAYDGGFSVSSFFPTQSTGIISARDDLVVGFSRKSLEEKFGDFLDPKKSDEEVRTKYFGDKKSAKYLPGDSRGWRLSVKRPILQKKPLSEMLVQIHYRPLDTRWMVYDEDIVDWPRLDVMKNFIGKENIALLTPRMTQDNFSPLVSRNIVSNKTASRYDQSYVFPLYIYPDGGQDFENARRANVDKGLFERLQSLANHPDHGMPDELEAFDYIYGILHCPGYREMYSEFLKIDFPKIPWPKTPSQFWKVSLIGAELRKLHLMNSPATGAASFPFIGEGKCKVDKPCFEAGKIWINATQYFENVPDVSWNFFIGGYQPAQKWLKDRKGLELSFEDIKHYQKVLKVLCETDRLMKEISVEL